MKFQDKGVEDFVREAEAQGVNSFELAEQQACTAEDPNHPGLTCNLVEHGNTGHYALGYHWDSPQPYQAFGQFHPEYQAGDQAANDAVPAREGYKLLTKVGPVVGECPFCGDASTSPLASGKWYCECCHQTFELEPSQAVLNAFADAIEDYVAAYDTDAAETEGAEADRSWHRQSLVIEGQELLARFGVKTA